MKKILVFIMILSFIALVACTPEAKEEMDENKVGIDTNDNGVNDVSVESIDEGEQEVTIDFDDVQNDETKEALKEASGNVDFCIPGETYNYASEEGSVESIIVGLTTYKGSEFCEAKSVTEIESPVGTITTDTTYYFDNTYKEFWVVTTTSSPMMPEPQVNEIHIVDGQVA